MQHSSIAFVSDECLATSDTTCCENRDNSEGFLVSLHVHTHTQVFLSVGFDATHFIYVMVYIEKILNIAKMVLKF